MRLTGQKCFQYVRDHKDWSLEKWKKVTGSDESRVILYQREGDISLRRKADEVMYPSQGLSEYSEWIKFSMQVSQFALRTKQYKWILSAAEYANRHFKFTSLLFIDFTEKWLNYEHHNLTLPKQKLFWCVLISKNNTQAK